jgi:hypothetical protein
MNRPATCLLSIFLVATANARSLDQLAAYLNGMPHFYANAEYEVLMPMLEQPISYGITLQSNSAPADTLSPADYLIEWTLHSPLGDTTGFDSYFNGNHFRFRNKRLTEYHLDADHTPFAPNGNVEDGVQQRAQFADLLPQFLGAHLQHIAADNTYHYELLQSDNAITISGTRAISGYDCQEYTYTFDSHTLLPKSITLENNPGQLGEQSISVSYNYGNSEYSDDGISYDQLLAKYPEIFSLYRLSAYTFETMPGKPLPKFNARTIDDAHYTHAEKTALPTVIVFLDSEVATTSDVIDNVRKACNSLPFATSVIWAYISGTTESIATQIGSTRPDETALIHIRKLARECGIVNTPAILFCDTSNTIRDYIHGYNNSLQSLVMQKAALTSRYSFE